MNILPARDERLDTLTPQPPWPPASQAWYSVFILGLVLTFLQLDLNVLSLLVEPIKRDWKLSDTEVSLLLGFTIALFYAALGLPLARFGDRTSRKWLLALGIGIWSAATVLCGVAQSYWQLFICRVGLGAGESINGPVSYSLLADLFPRNRLPRAISVFLFGGAVGNGLGMLGAAGVISLLVAMPPISLGGAGRILGWQMVLIVVGIPGLLVSALIALTVREPARRRLQQVAAPKRTMGYTLAFLARNRAVYGPLYLALAIGSLAMGIAAWTPAFYQRTYGWSPAQVGAVTGITQLFVMPAGLLAGVFVVEWLARRRADAALRVVMLSRLLSLPLGVLAPLMPDPWLAVALFSTGTFVGGLGIACQNAVLQIIAPGEIRGQLTALYLFIPMAFGTGLGPTVVALVTEHVFHSGADLRYSLALVSSVLGPVSLAVLWLGSKAYAREINHQQSERDALGGPT